MKDTQSILETIEQMTRISEKIIRRLNELRPITNQIAAGNPDPAFREKTLEIQAEINRLHELRQELRPR